MLRIFNKSSYTGSAIALSFVFSIVVADTQKDQVLDIYTSYRGENVIVVNHQIHLDYGLSYPITYIYSIPNESVSLRAYKKSAQNTSWAQLTEKTAGDFFNGLEIVRFDYFNNKAYVSVSFSEISDSIFIKMDNSNGDSVDIIFDGISKYYDNRDAVVTSTADDWASWCNEKFVKTCRNFRSLNLWISCGIVTAQCDPETWSDIQIQLDSGFVEAVSHSKMHPYVPYEDLEGEVLGSKQDIIDNLNLPEHNSYGDTEYVYIWIAPYGQYDDDIDSMVSIGKYLTSRLYETGGNFEISNWNSELFKYDPVEVSTEIGPLWLGSTDLTYLNQAFDQAVYQEGIYHVMLHPNVIEWEEEYTWAHLEYISNRNNIWYVAFGHLYLYDFLSSIYPNISLELVNSDNFVPKKLLLNQNYPNPFNSTTKLKFEIKYGKQIKLDVYDYKGFHIKSIMNKYLHAGNYTVIWDGTDTYGRNVSSGLYMYSINNGFATESKKMIMIK